MRTIILLGLMMALTACGKPDNAPGPGGVTVGEARALDEAAEMIEAQRLPPTAVTQPPAQPAAAAQPSGPPPKR